ncbi:MAG TPA: nucleotidyltransferase family protein [Puia sp.]|jgi:molybdenum cofactor cytidylyltransferase
MNTTAIIILAAGNSSRLKKPKQLLPYQGSTLIGHITRQALLASLHPVVVVTGAFATEVNAALQDQPVEIVFNEHWKEGMASGIVTGLSKILTLHPGINAIIIAVADQPYISAALLQELTNKQTSTGKGIIACTYSDTIGTPALYSRHYFSELSSLSGNEGAKKLLKHYAEDIATIPFPLGHIDIDTEEDYQQLLSG